MTTGDRITTADGRDYELACRAKCGQMRGWFACPVKDGKPDRDRERWIADEEIMGRLSKNGQYLLEYA